MINDPNQEPLSDTFEANREGDDLNVRHMHEAILREKDDPREGYEPIPLWLVSLFMALVFWGGAYLAFNSGGFQADVFNPSQVSWAGGGGGPKAPPDPLVVGKRLYTANCVACHQVTGQGVAGQFPPLAGSDWVVGGDWHGDNHLVNILLHGLQGPVQVMGGTYNGAMPAWKQMKDNQIAMILTYIRNEWGNEATPITAEQVAQMREENLDRREPWTQAQLQAIPAKTLNESVGSELPPSEDGELMDGNEPPDAAVVEAEGSQA